MCNAWGMMTAGWGRADMNMKEFRFISTGPPVMAVFTKTGYVCCNGRWRKWPDNCTIRRQSGLVRS